LNGGYLDGKIWMNLQVNGVVGTTFKPNISALAPDSNVNLDFQAAIVAGIVLKFNIDITIDLNDQASTLDAQADSKTRIQIHEFVVKAVCYCDCYCFAC
jgi:hypothetical protein